MYVNNRMEKSKYSKEEIADRKEHWRSYMATFKAEIQGILQSSTGTHIRCEECEKSVTVGRYLRHRTLQGCSKQRCQVKQPKNFSKEKQSLMHRLRRRITDV